MSGKLADDVFRREIPPGLGRDVLVVFALHANEDGTDTRPGLATVAAKVKCSERTVRRHVRRWVDAGVMEQTAKPRPLDGRGGFPNVYAIHLEAVPLAAMFRAGDGTDTQDVQSVGGDGVDISGDGVDTAVPGNVGERPYERPEEQNTCASTERCASGGLTPAALYTLSVVLNAGEPLAPKGVYEGVKRRRVLAGQSPLEWRTQIEILQLLVLDGLLIESAHRYTPSKHAAAALEEGWRAWDAESDDPEAYDPATGQYVGREAE